MSLRTAIGTVVLVLMVPLMLLVGVAALGQQSDEVAANSVTTGEVIAHQDPLDGPARCDFAYTVDGTRYEAQDSCDQEDNPVGAKVQVNYVADDPGAGFLHGDKTWWDKAKTLMGAGAVIAGIFGISALLMGKKGRAEVRGIFSKQRDG